MANASCDERVMKRAYGPPTVIPEKNSMKDLNVIHEQELVSVKTLSEKLDIPQKTIRKWVYKRSIPFYKVGQKLVRFNLKEVRDWYVGSASKPQQFLVGERVF